MNFDLIAKHYNWMEKIIFRSDLEKVRSMNLALIKNAKAILLLGDGDGRFLEQVSLMGTDAFIVSVDSSAKMIDLSKRKLEKSALNVEFNCTKIEDFQPIESFKPDLIIAHFFLDCFTHDEVKLIIDRVSEWAAVNAKFVISDFSITKKTSFNRIYQKMLTSIMISFFRLFCGISTRFLPNIPKIMTSQGWNCLSQESLKSEFINSWVWQIEGYAKRP
jgi:ubiquinone/menaquinone biosynthesis C-methylase UbiE